jgi:hypothetical protein
MIFSENYGGNPSGIGCISVLRLKDLAIKRIFCKQLLAHWLAAYDPPYIYSVGESSDLGSADPSTLRLSLIVIDVRTLRVKYYAHPLTGDANEGISILVESDKIIIGERVGGGIEGRIPGGGGLWVIPKHRIYDWSSWKRVYEDPNRREWDRIFKIGDTYYARLGNDIVRSTTLTDWTVIDTAYDVDAWGDTLIYVRPTSDGTLGIYSLSGLIEDLGLPPQPTRIHLVGKTLIILYGMKPVRVLVKDLTQPGYNEIGVLDRLSARASFARPRSSLIALGFNNGSLNPYIPQAPGSIVIYDLGLPTVSISYDGEIAVVNGPGTIKIYDVRAVAQNSKYLGMLIAETQPGNIKVPGKRILVASL